MKGFKLFIVKTFLGRKKSLAELKSEVSEITSAMLKEIRDKEINETSIVFLSQLILNQDDHSAEVFKVWADKVSNDLVPASSKKTDEFLYERRWDIAALSKDDHTSLRQYISYSGEVCANIIEDKVADAITKAESILAQESILQAILSAPIDDTMN